MNRSPDTVEARPISIRPFLSAILLGLALIASACEGGASTPTSPGSTQTSLTYTLSGTVLETTSHGSAPIEGAHVTDRSSRKAAVTDVNGLFSIPGLPATMNTISITRQGYVTETTTLTLSADTELAIRLERLVTNTLSGVVFEFTEAGLAPVEGVEVYCDSCGSPDGHTFVHTDANGFYSLGWAVNGIHPLFFTKDGYRHPTGALLDDYGRIRATVNGDTRFDVELVRR